MALNLLSKTTTGFIHGIRVNNVVNKHGINM